MPWIEQIQSANWREASGVFFGAYILGCFATGYYLVRWRTGQDIRESGSGNVGAKNVGRLLGWKALWLTMLADGVKGAFAVWAARHISPEDHLAALAMLGVVAGHVWPAQLRFRGGKGISTSVGALLFYDWHLAAALVVLFACVVAVLRKPVLAGLIAFGCLPLASLCLGQEPAKIVGLSVLAALVLIAHRKNLLEEMFHALGRGDAPAKNTPPEL